MASSPERDTQIEKGKDRDSSSSFEGRVTDEMVEAAGDAWLQAFYALEPDEDGLSPWVGTVQEWREMKVLPALPCVDGPDGFLALIRASLDAAFAVQKRKENPSSDAAGVVPKADLEAEREAFTALLEDRERKLKAAEAEAAAVKNSWELEAKAREKAEAELDELRRVTLRETYTEEGTWRVLDDLKDTKAREAALRSDLEEAVKELEAAKGLLAAGGISFSFSEEGQA